MTPLMLGRLLVIAACQVMIVSAGLAQQDASYMSGAQELVMAGRHEEALTILRPLAAGRQVEPDVLFHLGMAAAAAAQVPGVSPAARAKLLNESAAAYSAMLVQQPGLIRVRLELAYVLFLKGEDRLAKEHFERALAGNPPAPVVANIHHFLAEIRARRRWSAHFGFALAPDSNIGASSDDRIIYINTPFAPHPLPFRRNEEELTSSGVGVSVWAGGEYQHPLNERWRLRFGGNVSRTEHKGSKFDRMALSVHAGPRWLINRDTEASLLAISNRRWTANDPDHVDLGLRFETAHRLSRRTTVNLQASWLDRRHDTNSLLNGPIVDLSLGANYLLTSTLRVNTGIGWSRELPEREASRNTGRRVQAGITAALPQGFTVGGGAEFLWTNWEGNWSSFVPDGQHRADTTGRLSLSVHHRAFTVSGFSPELSLKGEKRTSNAQGYNFERVFGELSFVRPF